ncbi:cation transport regulator protein 1-like [Tropilaelaps mercedesae]|uniref:Cation transport regulator protein 1-like n=1 Tax=Tropilaelaps mercedesae TaxID=418985 RepID=A0A1V9Y0P4_9ACAR|nr:cation transport regulator protein 1-like [Tropilaelaps mercedesae]
MREEVWDVDDEHLFMLEMHIVTELANQAKEEQSFQAQVICFCDLLLAEKDGLPTIQC